LTELSRLYSFLEEAVKKYIQEVRPEILNGSSPYLIEHPEQEDQVMVYNLEVAKVEDFPVYQCIGGDTPPTHGCGKLISDAMLENQDCYIAEDKPLRCPHCGGTDFREIKSLEEWRKKENYDEVVHE
jgi:hypothetical protein